jgi:hypothetical protein
MSAKKLTNLLILSVALSSPVQGLEKTTKDTIKNTTAGTAWAFTAVAAAAYAVFHAYVAYLVDIFDGQLLDYDDDALGGWTIFEHNALIALLSVYGSYKALEKAHYYFKKIKIPEKLNTAKSKHIEPVE